MVKNLLVDLHVHTPASIDYNICADSDIEASYLNIIKLAEEKNIDVIGIADHFSVNGYEKLMQLKNLLNYYRKTKLLKMHHNYKQY